MFRTLHLLLSALFFATPTSDAFSDPIPQVDGVEIRRILGLNQGTVRIAKDPRDNTLYVIRQNGTIERIALAAAGAISTRTTVYTASDHGISGIAGFAIGPDGSMYLSNNQRGPATGAVGQIVRGALDANGNRVWQPIDQNNPPAGTPMADIEAAVAAGATVSRDATTDTRYALRNNGEITLVPSGTVYTAEDHGLANARALFIDAQGTFYLATRIDLSKFNIATVVKGQLDASTGERNWFTLVQTEPFEQCDCIFNHQVNGLLVSPDNRSLFINSGSRTDHGEVQNSGGSFPDMRETELTAVILRVPTDARDLVLPNDRKALRERGFLYAEGVRNTYDLAFAPNGDLFGTENGPDRDMSDELNWLREGHHYGFPWRLGLEDNPQRFPDYDPAADLLLPANFNAVRNGYYHNDPSFPPPPGPLTDPVLNVGPDADSFRDPQTGQIKDGSEQGQPVGTFTAHRSPLGLVFDSARAMAAPFQGDGFVLSWTDGDPNGDSVNGPFKDPSEDLLHLELEKRGELYQARVKRIVGNFANPIDAEIIDNKIYVMEWGGGRELWEITLPLSDGNTAVVEALETQTLPADSRLDQNFPNPFNPATTIRFQVAREGRVELAIYDIAGQKVSTLVDASLAPGRYQVLWDGRNQEGQPVASGTYLYRLSAGPFSQTRQLTLLK